MPTGRRLCLGATLAAILAAGCQQTSERPAPETSGAPAPVAVASEVVATYQGHTLTTTEVLAEMERLPGPSRTYLADPERKRQFVENLVMNELIFDEGRSEGLDKDAEIERQVQDLRKRLVVQRVMRKYQTPPTITDEQARAYYDQNQELYSTAQLRASHILVKDDATARAIRAELEQNPDRFADLAREKSTDTTSARRGGDLGTFGQGRMVPDFERAAFRLQPGQLSEIVKTQYGYHIIKVTERKDGEPKPFDQVKESIRAMLRNQALQTQVQGHFDELRKNSGLAIDEAVLAKLTPPAGSAAPGNPHTGH